MFDGSVSSTTASSEIERKLENVQQYTREAVSPHGLVASLAKELAAIRFQRCTLGPHMEIRSGDSEVQRGISESRDDGREFESLFPWKLGTSPNFVPNQVFLRIR